MNPSRLRLGSTAGRRPWGTADRPPRREAEAGGLGRQGAYALGAVLRPGVSVPDGRAVGVKVAAGVRRAVTTSQVVLSVDV